jgi:8-oxo-dGTP pyrophosphatase MutT (NUDIX family)
MRVESLKAILKVPSRELIPKGDPKTSSVLVPVGWNPATDREEILLTKRTQLVETHKGQVSFPGGFCEDHDAHVLETALRESMEEIGTKAEDIEIIGALEPVKTRGDILIYPWVGLLKFPYPFLPNPGEVDSLLYLSVTELVEHGLKPVDVEVGASRVKSHGIYVSNELVWGATARMLEQLRDLLMRL